MKIDFRIDAKDFTKRLKKMPDILVKEVKDVNNSVALDIISDAKQNINDNGSVDRGFLKNKAVYMKEKDNGLSMEIGFDAPYAYNIEFGREKGSFPPKKAIEKWVKRKKLPIGIVWPVMLKIYNEGIPPKPFLFPAVQKNVSNLRRRLLKLLK